MSEPMPGRGRVRGRFGSDGDTLPAQVKQVPFNDLDLSDKLARFGEWVDDVRRLART